MKNKKGKKTLIGGQAVMEGIMMRGARSMALAVRDPEGNILLRTERFKKNKGIINKIPLVRGAVMFFQTMVTGVKTLLKSAEVYGEAKPKSLTAPHFWLCFWGLLFLLFYLCFCRV